MKIRVIPRRLRFKQPAGTSRGVYRERRVWYVVMQTEVDGQPATGVGECAPLYDLSCDYAPDYGQTLRRICLDVERTGTIDKERLRPWPSILFGLETALLSAQASVRQGDYRLLFPSDFSRSLSGIRINGLVWMGTFDEMSRRMDEKLRSGFCCVKLKIGAIGFEEEMELVRQLRRRYPADAVELRVDANGGFSPADAPRRLDTLARYQIHSIEQPIRQGQWDEMARLCRQTPVPIALDEELIGVNDAARKAQLLDEIRPQYIILKPTLHGGLSGADEWIDLARERSIGYWATSALESNVGLNAIAQWSAKEAFRTGLPQGLGTGQLFVENYRDIPLRIEGDRLWYGSERQRDFCREINDFTARWHGPATTMDVHTSGSTGRPKPMTAGKEQMRQSALATIGALGLRPGSTALLCMPLRYIAGQMVLVRAMVGRLRLMAAAPSSHPYASLRRAPHFAALTPMQVHETMLVKRERRLLRQTRCLIIGGGAVPPEMEQTLSRFPGAVYSTYGMTETLSHIALRRLNGPHASAAYRPLPGVEVSLSAEGTLCIYAPRVNPERLITNDVAELLPDGTFLIKGRRDNVVCSGGIKMQIEEIERKLAALPCPYIVSYAPDERLGQALTLLYASDADRTDELREQCRALLSPYEVPRHFIRLDRLPLTATGKPARAEALAIIKHTL